jgi:cytosine/adenosine deaminase-related metal-dependent hydrolase
MPCYSAAWVLPMDRPPVAGGTITIDGGFIKSVDERPSGRVEDLGAVALLPGLVNAHTHLELSWMRGQIPPADSMPRWAAALMQLRRSVSNEPPGPIVDAIAEARASGTCLVGDVTNTLATYEPLAESDLSASIFRELLGFNHSDPDALVAAAAQQIDLLTPIPSLRPSIVPHAPYSVSPALFAAIRRAGGRPVSIHLGESEAEMQFLRDGSGLWRTVLESIHVWNPAWAPPRCGPVEYMDRVGLLDENLIAVHGVRFTDDDLSRLAARRATVVTCPRSNQWTGAGIPPIEAFYGAGVRVAIGTDSLASVEDLNLFAELARVRQLAPSVPARAILHSATQAGAEALGFGLELGTLAPGKRAQVIAVRLPARVVDVEEYLVSGIEPRDVQWLDPG